MPPALADLLKGHLDRTHGWCRRRGAGCSRRRRRPTPLRQLVPPGLGAGREAAGLDGLTFHDLRRANATGLVAAGVDVKTAQTRLGHSSSRLTLELTRSPSQREIGMQLMPWVTFMPGGVDDA